MQRRSPSAQTSSITQNAPASSANCGARCCRDRACCRRRPPGASPAHTAWLGCSSSRIRAVLTETPLATSRASARANAAQCRTRRAADAACAAREPRERLVEASALRAQEPCRTVGAAPDDRYSPSRSSAACRSESRGPFLSGVAHCRLIPVEVQSVNSYRTKKIQAVVSIREFPRRPTPVQRSHEEDPAGTIEGLRAR